MATRRYGISEGENRTEVTEAVGAATASDTVEVTIDLADNMTRAGVLNAIDLVKQHIVEGIWPPA